MIKVYANITHYDGYELELEFHRERRVNNIYTYPLEDHEGSMYQIYGQMCKLNILDGVGIYGGAFCD